MLQLLQSQSSIGISSFAVGLPFPPWTPSFAVQQYGTGNTFLTIQWQPPQYDGGAPVNYTIIISPGFSPLTTSATSVPVILPYNVFHTVSIVATNCNGSSSAAVETIKIGMLQFTLGASLICLILCSTRLTSFNLPDWQLYIHCSYCFSVWLFSCPLLHNVLGLYSLSRGATTWVFRLFQGTLLILVYHAVMYYCSSLWMSSI